MSKDQFPPSINAGQLYERTSAKGLTYLVGFLGPVRLTAFRTSETDQHGNPIWNMKLGESPQRDKPNASASDPKPSQPSAPKTDAQRDWQRPISNSKAAETADEFRF